jgi:hypothetical protein
MSMTPLDKYIANVNKGTVSRNGFGQVRLVLSLKRGRGWFLNFFMDSDPMRSA